MAYDSVGTQGDPLRGASYACRLVQRDLGLRSGRANAWTNLNPSGTLPPARYQGAHGVRLEQRQGDPLWWDGREHQFNDTWAYDPATNTWTDLNPSGAQPPARSMFGMAYDSSKDRVVLFGGLNSTPTSATY